MLIQTQTASIPVDGATPAPVEKNATILQIDCAAIVAQIQADEETGFEQLYRVFTRGLWYYLSRQLGPDDADDRVHDILIVVIQAIRKGDLREPERLMGFVRTVAHRHVAAQIECRVQKRQKEVELDGDIAVPTVRPNPEQELIVREKAEIMKNALSKMSPKNREILERFYLLEQRPEEICREMSLTGTQFRLMKSRAKAALGEVGQQRLKPRPFALLKKLPLQDAS